MGKPLLLVEAATSYQPYSEDRLTELFAATLDSHRGFCQRLCTVLGLPPAERHEIETQYRRVSTCRPDMRIVGVGSRNEHLFVIYSEHKIEGYGFGPTQVARERELLNAEPGKSNKLICVVPESSRVALDADAGVFDQVFTWDSIAELAHEAGVDWQDPWGGRDWWQLALQPEAPACQRLLAEFLAYLNEEEVLEAINADDLLAFHLADDAETKMSELLVIASQNAGSYTPKSGKRGVTVEEDETETGVAFLWLDFEADSDQWLATSAKSTLSVALATADAGTGARTSEPTVYAGIYLDPDEGADAAQADAEWMAAASDANFTPLPYRAGLWLCRSIEVGAITGEGRTLREQGVGLGSWVAEALAAAASLPKPPAKDPDKSPRSRR